MAAIGVLLLPGQIQPEGHSAMAADPLETGDIIAKVFGALFGTPIAAVVMTACILMLLSPIYMPMIKKLRGKA